MSNGTLHTLNRHWGSGNFITVRRGQKYADAVGQTFELCECWGDDHAIVGSARVNRAEIMELDDIPAVVIETHYNEGCRLYSGLLAALRTAYGADAVDDWTEVTVLHLSTNQPSNQEGESE